MKNIGFALILALCLTKPASAQEVNGTYRFLLEDNAAKTVEIEAKGDARGNATGWLTLTDEAKISDGETVSDFYIQADVDELKIEKNRALVSGVVTDSSHKSYIGTWVQLVIEDNPEDSKLPDNLTWSFCRPREAGWIPSDAEVEDDDGVSLRWWATDAERDDDEGIPSVDLLADGGRSCPVQPLSAYAMVDIRKSVGDLVVIP